MKLEVHTLRDDSVFPNNAALPVLVYRDAFDLSRSADPGAVVAVAFSTNGWTNGWRNGIYDVHHYHSTAHEALGCYEGSATVQLGGPRGIAVQLHLGDVLVVPAGVAHKALWTTSDLHVYGAYAGGRDHDMNYGRTDERPRADHRIARVPLPDKDPVCGTGGPLQRHWEDAGQPARQAGARPLG